MCNLVIKMGERRHKSGKERNDLEESGSGSVNARSEP